MACQCKTQPRFFRIRRKALYFSALRLLNPEERLNANLKHAIGTRVPVRTKAKLKAAASEHMAQLEQSPEQVMAFFHDSKVHYAA